MEAFDAIPPEIIESIILHLDPLDVARVARCSKFFRLLIYSPSSEVLWRNLYLRQPFDDPRLCVSPHGRPRTTVDWKTELQSLIRVRTVMYDTSLCRPGERVTILKTLLDMVSFVRPLSSVENYDGLSRNLVWVAAMLRGGRFLEQDLSVSAEETQICARLHTYFGLTHLDTKAASRVRSRAYIYDLRNYRLDNDFGPFDALGCVNWVHIQVIHHAVSMHIVDLQEDENFEYAIFPMSLPFTQPVLPEGVDPDAEEDWAGVAGSWRVSFCFCDHRELIRYNESATPRNPNLDTSIFEQPTFGEVFRSMNVNIRVTGTHPDSDQPKRPIIEFVGEMKDSSSTMSGQVKLTPDDHVRWYFLSGEQGNAVWSSQGVQIGGLRSSFGILGSWTTIFHDDDDPVGPFWLRRQSELVSGLPMNHLSVNSPLGVVT